MPSKSKAQERLMGAALHGAKFPMARTIRETMSNASMRDFASGSMNGKPAHVVRQPHANLGKFMHPKRGK